MRSDATLVERFTKAGRVYCAAATAFSRGAMADRGGCSICVVCGRFGRIGGWTSCSVVIPGPGRRGSGADAANSVDADCISRARSGLLCDGVLRTDIGGGWGKECGLFSQPMAFGAAEAANLCKLTARPLRALAFGRIAIV